MGKHFTLKKTDWLLLFTVAIIGCVTRQPAGKRETGFAFCKPAEPCWPTTEQWGQLNVRVHGHLEVPAFPLLACKNNPQSEECAVAKANLKNPFADQEQSGTTQSAGMLSAWEAVPSAYAVAAQSAEDIVEAVNFARRYHIRLVVKGTGHDYLGRSTAPDSLLVWTHKMRQVTVLDAFRPLGSPQGLAAVPAVSVEAGTRWVEAYQKVTVVNGRYVQGGGCTTVGAAGGFVQGGGFGSWSKKYGTAASNLLEAHVVTADGRLVVANAFSNADLFWALRGGGGGTFGIVTKVTYATHPLPNYFGWVNGRITAKSDAAFKRMLERFLIFAGESLDNESWGEQFRIRGDNVVELRLAFLGLTTKGAERVWRPFRRWIDKQNGEMALETSYFTIPGKKLWNFDFIKANFPTEIRSDERPGSEPGSFWWTGDGDQVAVYWYAYQSRWIPSDRLSHSRAKEFANTLFRASRHSGFEIHFNKGQHGASAAAIRRGRETAVNPKLYQAAALIIAGASGTGYPGVKGQEPDKVEGEKAKVKVSAAMKIIRDATPGAGTYPNEADYFEPNWQQELWGTNYPKLLEIKTKYDPDHFFTCHHCVGSE